MRNTFINEIKKIASYNKNIMLLTADLGFSVVDKFAENFPDRYINCGISEQNMASVAAGLALCNKQVFIYSIANFPTLRCLEQIRNDIAYHNLNVNIIAVGGGLSYGALGITHHGTEDIAVMRAIPNMKVFAPCDPISAKAIAKQVCEMSGPSYIRLERGKEPNIFEDNEFFKVGEIKEIKRGKNIAIIAMGSIAKEAIAASFDLYDENHIDISVYISCYIKPIDKNKIIEIARKHKYIITVEEHVINGGLGSVISEILAEINTESKLIRLGLNDEFSSIVGNQEFLREQYGMDSSNIKNKVKELLNINE